MGNSMLKRNLFRLARCIGGALMFAVLPVVAHAQIGSDRYAAIVVDARSGNVLMEANADEPRYPASLTKMMTLYMAFDALRQGRIDLNDRFTVSAQAAAMPPSRLGLAAGTSLSVEEAILALVTKSANDAAAALGEYLGGGSELRFAQMMTLRARALGMRATTFRNASGLPDLDQVSSARDMAALGRRLQQDHPQFYTYFAAPNFVYRGRTHWNHNRLLQEYDGTDGIKTGYVNDSGFNLVASAQRDGVRLIAAVFGGRSGRERDRHMMSILDQGFATLGVRPRDPMVAARPSFVGRAIAAARPAPARRGPAFAATSPKLTPRLTTAVAARPTPPVRVAAPVSRAPAARSLAATNKIPVRTAQRSTTRVEQGDGGRSTTARPTAAKRPPVKTAAR